MVIIGAGRTRDVVAGTVFKAYRPKTQADGGSLLVELGHLKAVEVQDDYTVAVIEDQGSTLSRALFPRFPGIMAGDLVVPQRMTIARKQVMTPTVELAYKDLFQDPKGTPATFELRSDATAALKEAVKPFLDARLSLLMIEGYTDHNGPASANQVESYQRALTIRQYLIDEFGFDEKRVVAIGYGEAEPSDPSLKPGYETANRRIVLKAIPIPPAP
jgi:outer membrane protein OmpA-like peptidoglycan-associated protein